jgi:hypothetical protein
MLWLSQAAVAAVVHLAEQRTLLVLAVVLVVWFTQLQQVSVDQKQL